MERTLMFVSKVDFYFFFKFIFWISFIQLYDLRVAISATNIKINMSSSNNYNL